MINKSYAVLGLGRYGSAVARELSNSGIDVLAVDITKQLLMPRQVSFQYANAPI